ncbi:hypothetical protein TRAPUB_8525 [Trametes pubescens]|uniref:Uncharacterized protein n=1 Tax=Trametes pubescens TaxID=154538 RepID=A0A1M2W4Y5_TRAPU|nr:hypothetical protein TRAPUB_8525 [Trametes pubescens]
MSWRANVRPVREHLSLPSLPGAGTSCLECGQPPVTSTATPAWASSQEPVAGKDYCVRAWPSHCHLSRNTRSA